MYAHRRRVIFLAILTLMIAVLIPVAAPQSVLPDDRGWLGAYTEPVDSLPAICEPAGGIEALRGASAGLRVTAVFPDSPAEFGGLRDGDVIIAVCGHPLTGPADSAQIKLRAILDTRRAGTECTVRVIRDAVTRSLEIDTRAVDDTRAARFWRKPAAIVDSLPNGAQLTASVTKAQAVIDLHIILGLRPEARWPAPPANGAIYPPDRYAQSDFAPLVHSLAARYDLAAANEDLLARLARCHAGCDPYRLLAMTYVHRDPFRLESVSRAICDQFSERGLVQVLLHGAAIVSPEMALEVERELSTPTSLETLLAQIEAVLAAAREDQKRAFAALSEDERAYLERERWNLSDAFAGAVYLHFDEDRERFRKNRRLIGLAARVNYAALFEAAANLARLTEPEWALAAGTILRASLADSLERDIVLTRPTSHGRILIGGINNDWHRETDAAVLIDLGGDDFYSGNCGGTNGWAVPVAVCIDLEGDDAYESTLPSCQGAGCLGAGGLLDLSGDDSYIAPRWCQGSGYLGVGWLHDVSGDDTYRGSAFCQAVGLFGAGFLIDDEGNDRYSGNEKVQGVGLPKSIGALIDRAGDDEYYAKGLIPTGYGDAGIFDGWSQGCGMGFRTLASGGLGLLWDGSGADRMEAGNFSQGGGYYYGYGILAARGSESDHYIGSRYNQGFCAHQAIGVFLEEAGDDVYATRQGVAQGLAWDECVTLFEDRAGNDRYQGGSFFSQGASAHNSLCFFFDRAGTDVYDYAPGQARAGGNDYHGGTSFSLFVDEGGGLDTYSGHATANDSIGYAGEHGFFLDTAGSRTTALAGK